MNTNYRVTEIFTDEVTGDVVAKCYDILYGEEFEKTLGNPEDFMSKSFTADILQDPNYEMSDEIRSDLKDIFGIEEVDMADDSYEGNQFMNFDDEDDAALEAEEVVEESFDLREALNRIDLNTNNKYDLRNLYEACNLSENEKRALANIVYDQDDAEVIYDTLNDRYISGEEIGMPERVKDGVIHEEQIEEDLEGDLDKIYKFENAHEHPSILDNIKTLERSELVDHITPVTMYDTEVFEMVAKDGRVFYLVPSTLSQFDVYDEDEDLVTSGEFTRNIPNEVLADKSNLEFIYELVGGEYAGTYNEVESLPCFSGKYSRDWSKERAAGGFVSRPELDNKPELDGYLGPMMNGYRDGKMVLRYETQEVYDALSESKEDSVYTIHYYLNTAGRERRPTTAEDKDDYIVECFEAANDYEALITAISYVDIMDEEEVKETCPTEKDALKYIETSDWSDGGPFIVKLLKGSEALYDSGEDENSFVADLDESFPHYQGIDLDRVAINVSNLLDESKLGDNWIEVFPTRDAIDHYNGVKYLPLEITGADEVTRYASFRSVGETVEVQFRNGSEAKCNSPEEIARFIACEYGLTLSEAIDHSLVEEKSTIDELQKLADEANLILDELTEKNLEEFGIYASNTFTEPSYFVLDTGNDEQVVFAFDSESGNIRVEEDTNDIGISTSFNNPKEFIGAYKSKIYGGTNEAIEMTADEMKAKHGTDNPDIINAGKPEEERVALKESHEELEHQDILDWLDEYNTAYEDAQYAFGDVPLKDVPKDELIAWIQENDQMYKDFIYSFYEDRSYDLDETFKPGDMVHVKPNNKAGRVKSVKGDNVEVEIIGGNDPDRIDTYYASDLELQDRLEEEFVVDKETQEKFGSQPILHDEDQWNGKYKTYNDMWAGEGYKLEESQEDEIDKPYTYTQVFDELKLETMKFTKDFQGHYGYESEAKHAEKILSRHYANVTCEEDSDGFYVEAKEPKKKNMKESFNDYIYLFPELTNDDIKMMAGYNVKYLGKNHSPDGSEDNWVVYGAKEDLEKYAEKYLGYELHPDYLYDYDDFAGEIE